MFLVAIFRLHRVFYCDKIDKNGGATEEVSMKKTLIVTDMQNDFLTMALGKPEAAALVPKIKKLIEEYASRGDEIIYTRNTHNENYLETAEGKKFPTPHCISGTLGWEIADGLYVEGSRVINKISFGWPYWDLEDLQEVLMVGLYTDVSIISNALIIKTEFPEVEVTVDTAYCVGSTPETEAAAIEVMKVCQINVI
jgi:nicotinamidase-related amidase